jgi:threonine aldolase
MAGGRVWPLSQLRGVVDVAREHELRLHMDGARLMNAVVAAGVPASEFTHGFDTAWLDFTKGLGAPLGACLAGSEELIEEAWRYKQMLGGSLRQAGIVAAGALYALDHNIERLAVDHDNARALAQGLAVIDGVTLDPDEVETNIVIFEVDAPSALCAGLERLDVRMGVVGERRVRAVTHLDVDANGVQRAVQAVQEVLSAEGTT